MFLQIRKGQPGDGTGYAVKHDVGELMCYSCGVEFNSSMLLLVHQFENRHLDDWCCVCHKTFGQRGNLRRHIQSQHLQQQFPCYQCTDRRTFTRRENLHAHQLKHHGMITCEKCGAGFNEVKWWKEHLTKHHHK